MNTQHRTHALLFQSRRLLVAIALMCFALSASAQSEKDILEKYRKAVARHLNESDAKSMVLSGDFLIQKMHFPIVISYKPVKLMRLEMKFQNLTFTQVSNDSMRWDYDPVNDKNTITRTDSKQRGDGTARNSFDFVNYKLLGDQDKGHKLKLIGKQMLDSLEVYHLELVENKNEKTSFYLTTRDYLIYKIVEKTGYRLFMNYSMESGFVVPKYIIEKNAEQYIEGRFDKYAFDVALPDSIFVIPAHLTRESASGNKGGRSLLDTGDSLSNAGNYEKAVELYTKAIKNSHTFRAYNSRGLARIHTKEYYEAIADFNQALELDPSRSKLAFNNRGLAKFYLGDKEGAITDYTKAIDLDKSFNVALKNRGLARIHLGQYEDATKDFRSVIQLDSKDGEAHFKLGVALAQLDKQEEAIKSYHDASASKYTTAELYNYLGVSQYKLDLYDSARVNFHRAATLEPENLQYVENLGRALYDLEDYAGATEQFQKYLSKNQDQPEIINLIGLCKYRDENYKGAIKDFTKSIELNAGVATYFDNRAAAKEMIEDYVGAIKDYSESIRIYPNDPAVFYKRGLVKIYTSQKMEGCLDLATSNEMKYELAKEAILKNCN